MSISSTVRIPSAALAQVCKWYVILLTAPILCLIAVRLVMTPLFLQLEYHLPGFPEDSYGFTLEDRLHYGGLAVDYLLNGEDIEFLGDLKFAIGSSLYEASELRHMRDVKALTQIAYAGALGAGLIYGLCAYYLYRADPIRLRVALQRGAVLTIVVITLIVVFAATGWNTFFVTFHELFFSDGTWYFPYSDTLIRLFPEQFWFDAALCIGVLTLTGSAAIYTLSRRIQAASRHLAAAI